MTTAESAMFYNQCLDAIDNEVSLLEMPSEEITATMYNYNSWIYIPAHVFSSLAAMGVSFKKEEGSAMKITYRASEATTEILKLYVILSACRNSATVDIHGFNPPFIMFSEKETRIPVTPNGLDQDIQRFSRSGRTLCLDIFDNGFLIMTKEMFGGDLKTYCFAREIGHLKDAPFTSIDRIPSITASLVHALYVVGSGVIENVKEQEWLDMIKVDTPIIRHPDMVITMSIVSGMDMRPLLSSKILVSATNF